MHKLLITLVGVLVLGLGAVNAQTIDDTASTNYYAGASIGFATAGGGVGSTGALTGHFGYRDIFAEGLDGRADLGIFFSGGVNIGVSALYNFELEAESPITIYAGGGPRLLIDNDVFFGLGVRTGAEYSFSEVLDGFAELRLDPIFGPTTITVFGLGAGVNYNF